ncbi:replication initiation protein [Microvirus sp.]|nr:replication initiation protein [Microvirus sp.]
MACQHPIWIRNRRYYDRTRPEIFRGQDDHRSELALRPWDISRQWLMVPCGKCEDCMRRKRNDWFVRLERELSYCRVNHMQATFITITIAPQYYELALDNPSWFIRKWLERLRHVLGHSFKHAFFQEFGTHPETGTEPRLHFHGFLFGCNVLYNTIRNAVSDLGFIWLSKASNKRARYVVKYVVKQIEYDGNDPILANRLCDKKYTRKFISAHVGDYLGQRPAPSASVTSWPYMDVKTGVQYNYVIPRYYDRYLKPEDELIRSLRSADLYARFSRSSLVKYVVSELVKARLPQNSLSYRETYRWTMNQRFKFLPAGPMPRIEAPAWLDADIVQFWASHFNINLII